MIPASIALGLLSLALIGRGLERGGDRTARGTSALLLAGAGLAVAMVIVAGLAAPFSPWDTVRIAPAMALLRGYPLYAGRGSGAVLSTMYGPVATLAFVPAAMMSNAAMATILGRWMAFAFAFAPLVVCARVGDPAPGRSWRATMLLAGTFGMLLSPSLQYSATFLHADAPALGFLGMACLLTAGRIGTVRTGDVPREAGLAAAVFCVLAVMTKQTMVTLPPALVLATVLLDGRRAALRFAAILAATTLAVGVLTLGLLDRESLILNLVSIPGRVPWKGRAPGNLAAMSAEMTLHGLPFLIAYVVASRMPTEISLSMRRARVFAIAALALAPMAVLGRVKQAGDVNSFSPALYPLLLAAVSRAVAAGPPRGILVRRGIAATIAAAMALGATRLAEDIRLLAKERPFDTEAAYLHAHPRDVYFPWHPAAHLAVEGRPTHHLFSAWERGVAGYPISEEHLRSAMPSGCRYVAFPLKRLGPDVGFGSCVQMLERYDLLARPVMPVRLAGLPDYECYALTR